MSKTHWLQSPNKNYIGEWDLPEKDELILTIKTAGWEMVKNPVSREETSNKVIHFEEQGVKPFIVNQVNSERIIKSTGESYIEDTIGKKIALKRELYKDKRTKDEMMVVRVSPKPIKTELPELTPEHKHWEAAKKAFKDGKGKNVQNKFKINSENLKKLQV